MQAALADRIVSTSGLWRPTSARFGLSDLRQEALDEGVFAGARLPDLERRWPMVFINATDMLCGERFEFSQVTNRHLELERDSTRSSTYAAVPGMVEANGGGYGIGLNHAPRDMLPK